jgi:hypothetical protein
VSNTVVCVTVIKDGRESKRTVVRVTVVDHDVVSSGTGVRAILNESYHECGLLGQLDRWTTDWLVLGSLGMTSTNDCSHEMTESLMW